MLLFCVTVKVGKKSGKKFISIILNVSFEKPIIIKLYINK